MAEKRTNNPERSRAKILESAQTMFIERGFDGVSMSAIARKAGVTQSIIHHYFGSKEGLWQAVKKLSYDEYLTHQQQLLDLEESDMASFIQYSLRSRFRFFQENPQTARLLSWLQIMEDPTGMESGRDLGRRMVEKIRRAQAEGVIREDVEPEHVLAMALALTTYWFQSRHVIRNLIGPEGASADDAQDERDSRYLEAMITVFVDGLQPE